MMTLFNKQQRSTLDAIKTLNSIKAQSKQFSKAIKGGTDTYTVNVPMT